MYDHLAFEHSQKVLGFFVHHNANLNRSSTVFIIEIRSVDRRCSFLVLTTVMSLREKNQFFKNVLIDALLYDTCQK